MSKFLKQVFFFLIGITTLNCQAQDCGVERWPVKTLSDADTVKIDFNKVVASTIAEQTAIPHERGGQSTRLPSETVVYSIPCAIVGFKKEHDQDIHIIVEDTATEETMVVEVISAECASVLTTSRYLQFKNLEAWFKENIGHPTNRFTFLSNHIPVVLTGVGFFDFCHGQKGMSENCREIHPVLSINLLNPK